MPLPVRTGRQVSPASTNTTVCGPGPPGRCPRWMDEASLEISNMPSACRRRAAAASRAASHSPTPAAKRVTPVTATGTPERSVHPHVPRSQRSSLAASGSAAEPTPRSAPSKVARCARATALCSGQTPMTTVRKAPTNSCERRTSHTVATPSAARWGSEPNASSDRTRSVTCACSAARNAACAPMRTAACHSAEPPTTWSPPTSALTTVTGTAGWRGA